MNDANPYAPPRSDVGDITANANSADIGTLPTSPGWKAKFLIVLAFLFGPIYCVKLHAEAA